MVRSEVARKKINSEIKIVAYWRYSEEATEAFRRLMALLLRQKIEPKGKEGGKR